MVQINERLKQREAEGNPIRVGLVGVGQMGSEIATQIGEMVGMRVSVIVDITVEKASQGFDWLRNKPEVCCTESRHEAEHALQSGLGIATTDYTLATSLPGVDVVVDATGSTEMAARVAIDAINHGKHIVMMSVECDITIGPILRKLAENAGVVYSLAAGDEPAAIIELYRFADALGFEVVAAGKGKNNPLNIYANPDTERAKAEQRKMNPRMLSEFVDGSKTAIEMTAVSNATGLRPDVRGMHGPKSTVETLKQVFIPQEDGGVLNARGVVDYAIGVHPGVFIVMRTENEKIMHGMNDRDMGPGPYYTLYRPYHLCSVEVPITVALAALYGESSGHPLFSPVSECFAVAKKDIKNGDRLDGIGEYCYRGSIECVEVARQDGLLPLGIASGCVATRDIPKDTPITYADVSVTVDSVLMDLRSLQDKLHVG